MPPPGLYSESAQAFAEHSSEVFPFLSTQEVYIGHVVMNKESK